MSNYWQQRNRDKAYNQVLRYAETQLAKEYTRCAEATKAKLSDMYDEIIIATGNDTLLISDLYKYNRYYELMNVLNSNLNKLGQKEIEIYEECFKRMYFANSQLIIDELGLYKSSNLFVEDNSVKNAINAIWCQDGKHWSQRVWGNKAGLQEIVQKGIVDCVARGVSKNELVKDLMRNFKVRGFYEADRLARTELTYIQAQSTLDKYREAGLTHYQFLAELDDRTSQECREMNGKIVKISEAVVGENIPPLHPNCRSTIVAVFDY